MEDNTKRLKMCLITVPEGKFNKNGKQAIFKEITATLPELRKDMNPTKYTANWIKKFTNCQFKAEIVRFNF